MSSVTERLRELERECDEYGLSEVVAAGLAAIRAEVEAIAKEMREQYRVRKAEHPGWRDDFTPHWADRLAPRAESEK